MSLKSVFVVALPGTAIVEVVLGLVDVVLDEQ